MDTLTSTQRRALRARAHALNPVVMVSGAGLTDGVVAEINRGLKAHELIKIRVSGEDRSQRETLLGQICERTGAAAVQHIGKVLVVYRENPEPAPTIPSRKPARKPAGAKKRPARNPSAFARSEARDEARQYGPRKRPVSPGRRPVAKRTAGASKGGAFKR
jgi:RNA-binding protein